MSGEPIVPLASAIHAKPGAYALLLGSGVSKSAGILTGWEIAVDLIRRLAAAEGHSSPDDPAAWLAEHHGSASYSELLELLGPSPGDRHALLDPYFDASAEETERGLKAPTRAHRAIAQLVAKGYIRVILQTNFDRLTERALQDVGIDALVVASDDDARSVPPLHTTRALVIKLNGDRASPNLKNTILELETYEPEMGTLVSRVLQEHGLVVVGWSGEWDTALRSLLAEHQSGLFTTFWAHRGELSENAGEIVKRRLGTTVPIDNADAFFESLLGKVVAIEDLTAESPSSVEVAVAELKRYMTAQERRIQLRDLVVGEVDSAVRSVDPSLMPVSGQFDLEGYMARIRAIEETTFRLLHILANLAFYADEERHDKLLAEVIERLAGRTTEGSGVVLMLKLQRYADLLALYAIGLGALASGRVEPLLSILTSTEVRGTSDSTPIAYALAPHQVLDFDTLRATEELKRRKTPASDRLHEVLRPALESIIPAQERYDDLFDDLEYLLGIAMMLATDGRWGQIGRFGWRRAGLSGRGRFDGVLDRHRTEILQGLFDRDADRLTDLRSKYSDLINRSELRW